MSLAGISHRLTARDRTLAYLLDDHTALTIAQITDILFTSPTTCRHRLGVLRRLDFIARITRRANGGRQTSLWVPGLLSARLVALARGQPPPTPKAVTVRQDTVLAAQAVPHTVETNQFFVDLLSYARHHRHTRLARWWSPRHTTATLGGRIHPDGHGVWEHHGRSIGWWLEHDRSTMDHGRLRAKLERYRRLRDAGGSDYPVLVSLPTGTRETNFHRLLAHAAAHDRRLADTLTTIRVATCPRDQPGFHPAAAVWRLVGTTGGRLALADLPSDHGQPGPLSPGPPTIDDDPLYELGGS